MAPTDEPRTAEVLVRLSQLVDHVFAEAGRDHGLTPQQAQLLCVLIAGPVGMSELGRRMRLEKSSLTGLVDRVERRGLVIRMRDVHDRRAYRVGLTDDGGRLAVRTHDDVTTRLEAVWKAVSPEDGDRLTATIAEIVAANGFPVREL